MQITNLQEVLQDQQSDVRLKTKAQAILQTPNVRSIIPTATTPPLTETEQLKQQNHVLTTRVQELEAKVDQILQQLRDKSKEG